MRRWRSAPRHPHVGVLVLSQHADVGLAMKLLENGAEGIGYMLKDRVAELDEFADGIRRVAAGGSVLDPTIVAQLLGRRRDAGPLDEITPREREVLELMAEGRSNQGIADRMEISERGVQKHVTAIFEKLGLAPAPTITAACSRSSPTCAPDADAPGRAHLRTSDTPGDPVERARRGWDRSEHEFAPPPDARHPRSCRAPASCAATAPATPASTRCAASTSTSRPAS